jgi:CheY-like chemotaxis protein
MVADNGDGIEDGVLDKVFDPFFTTKEVGKGTGLGLAMVYGVVQGHRGVIEVDSQLGEGTAFRLYFPLTEVRRGLSEQDVLELPRGRDELILLVDDEQVVRDITSGILESLGYRVVTARDGKEGFGTFQTYLDELALVLTDVIMPGMGGDALADSVRKISPTMPVVFATGYDKDHVLGNALHLKRSGVLSKPFRPEKLAVMIRHLLDDGEDSERAIVE